MHAEYRLRLERIGKRMERRRSGSLHFPQSRRFRAMLAYIQEIL